MEFYNVQMELLRGQCTLSVRHLQPGSKAALDRIVNRDFDRCWQPQFSTKHGGPLSCPQSTHVVSRFLQFSMAGFMGLGPFGGPPSNLYDGFGTETRLRIPLAFGAMFAIVPSPWLAGFLRKRRHRRAGCCRSCGYDLRASRATCPECGTPRSDAPPRNSWIIPFSVEGAFILLIACLICSPAAKFITSQRQLARQFDACRKLKSAIYYPTEEQSEAKACEAVMEGADPNLHVVDMTALCWACRDGHARLAMLLLSKGADPNLRSSWRRLPPLFYAVESQNAGVVHALLLAGASTINPPDQANCLLSLALRNTDKRVFVELLEAGADANLEESEGRPFFLTVAERLRGKDLRRVIGFYQRDTPVHLLQIAAHNDYRAAFNLISAGVDPEAADANGRSALDVFRSEVPPKFYAHIWESVAQALKAAEQ